MTLLKKYYLECIGDTMDHDNYYNLKENISDLEHDLKQQIQELQIESLFLLHTTHMQNLKLNQAIPNLNLPTYEHTLIFEPLEVFKGSPSQNFAYTKDFYIHDHYGDKGLPLKTFHTLNYAEHYYPLYPLAFDPLFDLLANGYVIRHATKYSLDKPKAKELSLYFKDITLIPEHKAILDKIYI